MADTGDSLPSLVHSKLDRWGITLIQRRTCNLKTTKGWTTYSPDKSSESGAFTQYCVDYAKFRKAKQFRYLAKVEDLTPLELSSTTLLSSQTFHLHCSPAAAQSHIEQLVALRRGAGLSETPIVVWEPEPRSCESKNLTLCREAARLVDVLSPNHLELGAFFGVLDPSKLDNSAIEQMAESMISSGIGNDGNGAIVIRAAERECFVASKSKLGQWLPAYHNQEIAEGRKLVVDPTGAGNACSGAIAVGLSRTGDIFEAAMYGMVAASFVVEQIGPPSLDIGASGEEIWNGTLVEERLRLYRARITAMNDLEQ
jgi:pfkB family carbohydrate kinase